MAPRGTVASSEHARPDELLERYQRTGSDADFLNAKHAFEEVLAAQPDDARLHLRYGFLYEIRARHHLRDALGHYERAIQADAADDKAHYQLISARAALLEPEVAVARYEKRLQDTPDSVREHRLLAAAYLAARAYTNALDVVARGLALDGADARLVEFRGDARAGLGDSDGALKDWRRALELDSTTISALYSTAFLHERDGRIDDAIAAWQEIIQWSRARGFERDIQWPHDEIERLGGSAARKGG